MGQHKYGMYEYTHRYIIGEVTSHAITRLQIREWHLKLNIGDTYDHLYVFMNRSQFY